MAEARSPSPEIVDRAFQDWLDASRVLRRALGAWLEARRANEVAARRYRMALVHHGPEATQEAQLETTTAHQVEVAA